MTSTAGKQLQPSGPYEVARPRDTLPVGKVIDLSGFPSYEQVAVIVDGRTAELASGCLAARRDSRAPCATSLEARTIARTSG